MNLFVGLKVCFIATFIKTLYILFSMAGDEGVCLFTVMVSSSSGLILLKFCI